MAGRPFDPLAVWVEPQTRTITANGIRRIYHQLMAVSGGGGGTDTVDVTLATTLTDYTKTAALASSVLRFGGSGGSLESMRLTSNTNLRFVFTNTASDIAIDGTVNFIELL